MATHAYGGCSSSQHHAGKANVLGYHHIAGLQALDDGEVRSVCPNADVKGLYPKAAACGRGVARVVAANAALKVLGAIARDYGVDSSASGNIERFARDGAGVGVDKQRGRGRGCGCWHGLHGRVLFSLSLTGILVTMYNGRLNLSLQVLDELKKHYADKLFSIAITRNVRLSEAPSYGAPIQYYDKYAKGSSDYDKIAEELMKRI